MKEMKNYIITIGLFLLVSFLGYGQEEANNDVSPTESQTSFDSSYRIDRLYLSRIVAVPIPDLEVPKMGTEEQLIRHEGYFLLYDEAHEQAKWVSYTLTKAETSRRYKRTDVFMPDPKVVTGSATAADYMGSGYDRGHLAPAADMGWSATAIAASFYYSNMSPQVPRFNRGIWKQLERKVRDWAIEFGTVYVVTGPVLTHGLKTIGPHQVAVPDYFYKVILEYGVSGVKGIGFVLPNAGSKKALRDYAVSIDTVEQITGIDFYSSLDDEQEAVIERTVCLDCWHLQ